MTIFDIISSLLIVFAIYLAFSCLWSEKHTGVTPTPVLPWIKKRAIKLIEKHTDTEKHYKIVDLGAGWGGVLASFGRKYPNAVLEGYEISVWPYRFAKLRALLNGGRFTIKQEDFFQIDISDCDIAYCYLNPTFMAELIPQFQTMKPGALIVSCSFQIPNWTPYAQEVVKGVVDIPIYIYKIKKP